MKVKSTWTLELRSRWEKTDTKMEGCTILGDFQRGWQPYLHHAATRTAWKPLFSQISTYLACWPRHHSLELCHGTTSKPRRHHLSSQLQLTYLTLPACLSLSPSRAFFICCCFLQPANPPIHSSLCCCCLSCVSFLCILSPGGPLWEAGDDSCVSSRSWGHVGSAPLRHCRVCEPQLHRGRNRGCTTSGKLWESRHS